MNLRHRATGVPGGFSVWLRKARLPAFDPFQADHCLRLPAAMIKLTDAIHQHPTRTFVAFLALHAAVWTVLPALLFINLPLDLIEGLVYGREWQLGYDKLPPLPWWMLEATYRLFGPDLFFYALSQLTVLAAEVPYSCCAAATVLCASTGIVVPGKSNDPERMILSATWLPSAWRMSQSARDQIWPS